jgi:hypothetical protein
MVIPHVQASPNIVIALSGNKADLTTNRIGMDRQPASQLILSILGFDSSNLKDPTVEILFF